MKQRLIPAIRAGEAGNGRDRLRDMVAAVMIKPKKTIPPETGTEK